VPPSGGLLSARPIRRARTPPHRCHHLHPPPLAVPATAPLVTAVAAPVHCSARPAPPAQAPVAGAAAASAALGGGGSVATMFTRAACYVPYDDDSAPGASKAATLPVPRRVRAGISARTAGKKARGSPAAERVRTGHGKRRVSSDTIEERRGEERPESGSSDTGSSDSGSSEATKAPAAAAAMAATATPTMPAVGAPKSRSQSSTRAASGRLTMTTIAWLTYTVT